MSILWESKPIHHLPVSRCYYFRDTSSKGKAIEARTRYCRLI